MQRKFPMYWNLKIDPEVQEVKYYFAIINPDSREITDITNKMAAQLPPVDLSFIKGKIDSINYKILIIETFNSKLDIEDIRRIYNGKLVRDKGLYERKRKPDGLEIYVSNKVKNLIDNL